MLAAEKRAFLQQLFEDRKAFESEKLKIKSALAKDRQALIEDERRYAIEYRARSDKIDNERAALSKERVWVYKQKNSLLDATKELEEREDSLKGRIDNFNNMALSKILGITTQILNAKTPTDVHREMSALMVNYAFMHTAT